MGSERLTDEELEWLWKQYFDYQRTIPTDRVVREYEFILSALRELKELRAAELTDDERNMIACALRDRAANMLYPDAWVKLAIKIEYPQPQESKHEQ